MRVVRDNRIEEFKRIEHLLYGYNYEVWFNLYGPADSDPSLADALKDLISNNCTVSRISPSSPTEAVSKIMDMVLYEGDIGSGPIDLDSKKAEISELMSKVFSIISIEHAELVAEFRIKEGHPAYPVFWDFAFDIHSKGERWILIGSSSD